MNTFSIPRVRPDVDVHLNLWCEILEFNAKNISGCRSIQGFKKITSYMFFLKIIMLTNKIAYVVGSVYISYCNL